MAEFPASWSLVKNSLPSLASYALGSVVSAYRAGKRARAAIDSDSRDPRVVAPMSRPIPARRVSMRRYKRRTFRKVPRPFGVRSLVRSTPPLGPLSLLGAGTTGFLVETPALNYVQTSDLTTAFQYFRIKKVVLHLWPRVDPSNSGVSNNFIAQVSAACDLANSTVPTAVTQVTAYENSRSMALVPGKVFNYTFYPRPVNQMGGAVSDGGYGAAPWISLDSLGIAQAHRCLKLAVANNNAATSNIYYDYYFDIHFDVKGFK